MAEKQTSSSTRSTPGCFGIASVVAGCLAWGTLYVVFNQGPDGPLNNRFGTIAVGLVMMFAFASGLLGIGLAIRHRAWLPGAISLIGLAIASLAARLVMGF
jgi:hypothetical protein